MSTTAPPSSPRHIAIFGGSFDPPHLGHVLCATWAWATATIDAIWVLPVVAHPYAHKRATADWPLRYRLCRAAFAGLEFVEVRDDERRNPGGTTFDLVQMLRRDHPAVHWHLIGGSDTEHDLPNWHRGEELMRMISVISVPRAGCDPGVDHALPAISSTEVRQRLARGNDVHQLVPRRVAAIIAEEQAYGRGG